MHNKHIHNDDWTGIMLKECLHKHCISKHLSCQIVQVLYLIRSEAMQNYKF